MQNVIYDAKVPGINFKVNLSTFIYNTISYILFLIHQTKFHL